MQGLRPLQAHQDENSGFVARNSLPGKAFGGEDGRSAGLGGLKNAKTGMPSARKALGNITNRGGLDNILPGKAPTGSVARKPLGPVFNEVAKGAITASAQAIRPNDERISKLMQDGVEKMAGKGWDELEREREARMDQEITDRLAAVASFGRRGLPTYYPHWASYSTALYEALYIQVDNRMGSSMVYTYPELIVSSFCRLLLHWHQNRHLCSGRLLLPPCLPLSKNPPADFH